MHTATAFLQVHLNCNQIGNIYFRAFRYSAHYRDGDSERHALLPILLSDEDPLQSLSKPGTIIAMMHKLEDTKRPRVN